jgi:RNA polymerase sigma factor (TIGR02999 family)
MAVITSLGYGRSTTMIAAQSMMNSCSCPVPSAFAALPSFLSRSEQRRQLSESAFRVLEQVNDVTRILNSLDEGGQDTRQELVPIIYEELRRLAAAKMAHERPGQTLQATALVHEAWLRLVGSDTPQQWNSRGHFFAAAAEAMRRILIDNARRRSTAKHGGTLERVELADVDVAINTDHERLLLVDEALQKLAAQDKDAAELIKLRFFAGMSNEEAARALGLSERTAGRLWAYARAWLFKEINRASA